MKSYTLCARIPVHLLEYKSILQYKFLKALHVLIPRVPAHLLTFWSMKPTFYVSFKRLDMCLYLMCQHT